MLARARWARVADGWPRMAGLATCGGNCTASREKYQSRWLPQSNALRIGQLMPVNANVTGFHSAPASEQRLAST
jgi:hypothetical protein